MQPVSIRDLKDRSANAAAALRRVGVVMAALLFAMVLTLAGGGAAHAQTVQRSFVNLSFEEPDFGTTSCFVFAAQSWIPGWTTSSISGPTSNSGCALYPFTNTTTRIIEYWVGGFNGVPSRAGKQHVELNAISASRVSQNVCLLENEPISWSFSHRGRGSATTTDVADFLIGSQAIVRVGTTTDGTGGVVSTTLGTSTSVLGPNGWRDYSGAFNYTGTPGTTNIGFGAVSSASGNLTIGNFLDAIDVHLLPFIELGKATFSTLEGASVDVPVVNVLGVVPTGGLTLQIQVTGGTATLGSDYSTPGGATTFSVIIPAGNYGTGQAFPLGFQALPDAITPEIDETVTFTLLENPSEYIAKSITVCGGDPIVDGVWTLRDNAARLGLEKSATRADTNSDGGPSAGDVVTYRFALTNLGNAVLTNVTLSDVLPGLTITGGPIASLAVGATNNTTFTGTYTITAADMAAGAVTNTATSMGTSPGGPIQSNPSTVVLPLAQNPAISITKTSVLNDNNRGFTNVGDTITYTFAITNTGNVALTNVIVTDPRIPLGIVGSPIASLAVGATRTLTANYTVTQADLNAGQVVNTATTSGSPPGGGPRVQDTDTVTTRLTQAPSMTLVKSAAAPSPIVLGSTIQYSFRVTNTGNVPISNLTIVDPQLSAPASCPVTTLALSAVTTCTGSHVVTQAEVDAGVTTNTAQAKGQSPSGGPVVSPPSSTTRPITRTPAFTVVKVVDQTTIAAPGTLNYTITVRNTGNVSLPSVILTDTLPNGQPGAPTGPTGDGNANAILDVGEAWVYAITFPVDQAAIDAGNNLVNTATVSAGGLTPVDVAVTTVTQNPAFSVDKTVDRASISTPGTLNYIIKIRNTGNVSLSAVTPVDTLPNGANGPLTGPTGDAGTPSVLDVGETWTYTTTYAASQADIDAGAVLTNSVTVNAQRPGGAAVPPQSDTAATTVNRSPRMTIDKSVDRTTLSAPGVLTYTVVVANTGNVDLAGVVVTDTLPDGTVQTLSAPAGDTDADGVLDLTETWTYTVVYPVSQAQIDAGAALNNVASAVSTLITTPVTDNAVTNVAANGSLVVDKTVDQTTIAAPGTLNYTITVRNTGNVSLNTVVPTDTLPDGTPATLVGPTGDAGTPNVLDVGETWTYTTSFVVTQPIINMGDDLTNTVTVNARTPGGTPLPPVSDAVTTGLALTPALSISKTVDMSSISAPGDLTYSIVLTNTGNIALAGVNVTDTLPDGTVQTLTSPAGDTNSDGVLNLTETWTYTVVYPVTQAQIDAGTALTNTVSAVSALVTTPVTDDATTTVSSNGSIAIDKVVDHTTINGPTTLNYTITVRNTGNVSLSAVTLADTLPDGANGTLTGPTGDAGAPDVLDVGEAWTFITTFVVDQPIFNLAADLTNTVTVSASTPGGAPVDPASDTATTTLALNPRMAIEKSVDRTSISAPGDLTYAIVLTNTGNISLAGVVVTDTLPDGTVQTLSSPAGDTDADGVLDLTETWTYTVVYPASQAQIDAGTTLVNTVSAVSTLVTTPVTDDAATSILVNARLLIDKEVDQTTISAPGTLNYIITVSNAGNTSLTGVTLNDALPDGSAAVLPAPSGDARTIGTLDVGETWTYAVAYPVSQSQIDADVDLVNTVEVTTTQTPTPQTAAATTAIVNAPALAVTKSVDLSLVAAPGPLTYTITVTNAGNVSLAGVSVVDTLPGGAAATVTGPSGDTDGDGQLDVTETWTYGATYVVTLADIDAGADLVNHVSVTSTLVPTPATASAVTQIVRNSVLSLTKRVDQSALSAPGTLTYVIEVTNEGNVSQTDLVLIDTLSGGQVLALPAPTGDAGVIGTLDPGETWSYTVTYAVDQARIDAGGEIVNVVTVTSTQTRTPLTAQAVTTLNQSASLSIVKTGAVQDDGNGFTNAGDRINYSFLVRNTGNTSLTNVAPRDAGPSFDGRPGLGTLSPFTPQSVDLAPGASQTFTAVYVLAQADVDAAAGKPNAVTNTAEASGVRPGGDPVTSPPSDVALTLTAQEPGDITIVKQSLLRQIRRGENAPYQIVVTNRSSGTAGPITVTDRLPPAFVYVEGSATLNGNPATPTSQGRELAFENLIIPPQSTVRIDLILQARSTAVPGRYTNYAIASDPTGPVAPPASAGIDIVAEAIFDCSDVIGKVFDDLNRNGYQDEGEPGLPAIRLVTARGLVVTTDQHGRYSIPCPALPNADIGSNFILKLDDRTLPSGYGLTTDNPEVARLTAGKMVEINFGAAIGRQVRLDLDDSAFAADSAEPLATMSAGLQQLVEVLKAEPSTLIVAYRTNGSDALTRQRLTRVEEIVRELWREAGSPYDLVIEWRGAGS